jgi:hypothetical protein
MSANNLLSVQFEAPAAGHFHTWSLLRNDGVVAFDAVSLTVRVRVNRGVTRLVATGTESISSGVGDTDTVLVRCWAPAVETDYACACVHVHQAYSTADTHRPRQL